MQRACDFNPSPINNTQLSKDTCAHYPRDSALRFKLKEIGDTFIELLFLLLFILVVLDLICLSVFTRHFLHMWYQVMICEVNKCNGYKAIPRNCSIVTNLQTYTHVSRRSLLSINKVKNKKPLHSKNQQFRTCQQKVVTCITWLIWPASIVLNLQQWTCPHTV